MKPQFALVVCALVTLSPLSFVALARADEASAQPTSEFPWDGAQKLLKTLEDEVQSKGVTAVGVHEQELKRDLTNPALTYVSGDTTYILTDGSGETLMAMVIATSDKNGKTARRVAINNPYPMLALYLGSYYNEVGEFDQAVQALNAGLAASSVQGIDAGEHRPVLLSERGAAFIGLKRWNDALSSENEALKGDDIDPNMRAHIERVRGFAFTELNKLDEATAAYEEALRLQPGDERSQHELNYIKGLRNGAMPAQSPGLAPLQTPPSDSKSAHP